MAGSVAVRIRSAEENHSEDGNDLTEGTVYTSDGTAESHRGSAVQRDQCQQEVLSRLAPPPRGGPAGHLQENGLPERALCSTDLELLWKLGH